MRKETIIAIISGVGIGVLIAFGIWRANSAYNSKKVSPQNSPESEIQTETSPTESRQLTIAQPEDNDVITSSPVKLTGITNPNIVLVISAEKKDYILSSGADGSFEQEIELVGGLNEIILAHSENGDTTQIKSLTLVYSSEFEKELSEND